MIRVGIIGTGNIGTDLLIKLSKTDNIKTEIFCGRRMESKGIQKATQMKIPISDKGIDFFLENPNYCDLVFDCTNSIDAIQHAKVFKKQNIRVIDLTPAKVGTFCVPSIGITDSININMITCGGQASIPLLHSISLFSDGLSYIEVVSQIASDSAGMATRINVDNYVETTESAIYEFTGVDKCKVILNLNPAIPQVNMQTTLFIKAKSFDFEPLVRDILKRTQELKSHIPGYKLIMPPTMDSDILILSVMVKGSGDYLPEYAGNLDIINCAAIEATKKIYEQSNSN